MLQPPRRRVVITGLGVVSPNGLGAPAFSQSLASATSGLTRLQDALPLLTPGSERSEDPDLHSPLPHFPTSLPLHTSAIAAILNFDPTTVLPPPELRRVPRLVPMAIAASREALAMSHLSIDPADIPSQRSIGVALGTGGGGMAFVEEQCRQLFLGGKPSLYSVTAGTHGNLSSELSIALHLRGPSHILSTGCASSTDALGYAAMLIRNGAVPLMLAGGADTPISPGILTTFERMRVISTRRWDHPSQSSRPFSLDRDGFVLGEGAWMFILEDYDHALARNAPILAEFLGYASTCDAYHRVQIAPELDEPVRAIELALQDANVAKDDIGYINLHGTGTDLNDRLETAAIKRAFGPRATRIPCSSTKSMIGHPQGACGAAGLAATLLSLRQGFLHPTLNLDTPDPACDLDYIPHTARHAQVDLALCNCIAFGSKNSALVVKRM